MRNLENYSMARKLVENGIRKAILAGLNKPYDLATYAMVELETQFRIQRKPTRRD